VILDQGVILTPDDGAATITQDDLGNTYDRGGGAYSNYKAVRCVMTNDRQPATGPQNTVNRHSRCRSGGRRDPGLRSLGA
jgi:hypothetical protein